MKPRTYERLNLAMGCKLDEVQEVFLLDSALDSGTYQRGLTCDSSEWGLLSRFFENMQPRLAVVSISPPVPSTISTDSQRGKFLSEYYPELMALLAKMPGLKCVTAFGKWPARILGSIGKVRGTIAPLAWRKMPMLATLSLQEVLRYPDRFPILKTDLDQLRDFRVAGYILDQYQAQTVAGMDYSWCLDLTDVISRKPPLISVDCETIGLDCHSESFRVLTVAITYRPGQAVVIPLDLDWWNNEELMDERSREADRLTQRIAARLIHQIEELFALETTHIVGHNLKFDIRALRTLGIDATKAWLDDTMQMAWAADENQLSFSLDDCVRRYLPDYSGYADQFNRETDKSTMQRVEHGKFLTYAAGDTDTCFQLHGKLKEILKQDQRQLTVYRKVQMPALKSFAVMEENGVMIDLNELSTLGVQFAEEENRLIDEILNLTPPAVLRTYEGRLRQMVPNMIKDALFGPDAIRVDGEGNITENGSRLQPVVFTAKTQEPSVSTREHLPYFEHIPYVKLIMDLSRVRKMISTYAGRSAHIVLKPVAKLKNGCLPKKVRELLAAHEVPYESRPKDRRGQNYETFRMPPGSIECGDSRLVWTEDGEMFHWETKVPASGIWQYLHAKEGDAMARIYPSYKLLTVTGRASSSDPNAQNQPKRGRLAKQFRRIFRSASDTRVLLEADESQAELRIAAWMANESNMIDIYRHDGDIHSATAAALVEASLSSFSKGMGEAGEIPLMDSPASGWKGAAEYHIINPDATWSSFCDLKRFQAKAVNFGFLYGMGWRKFKVYAKIEYGVDLTDSQAQEARSVFFRNYPGLEQWHKDMRSFVDEHTYVRSLHGALRRLGNIRSSEEFIQWGTHRKAINSPVQRFASDLALIALNQFVAQVPREVAVPIFFIHDALIIDVASTEWALQAAKHLRWLLENPPLEEMFGLRPPLPLKADVSMGVNLGSMSKLEVEPEKINFEKMFAIFAK